MRLWLSCSGVRLLCLFNRDTIMLQPEEALGWRCFIRYLLSLGRPRHQQLCPPPSAVHAFMWAVPGASCGHITGAKSAVHFNAQTGSVSRSGTILSRIVLLVSPSLSQSLHSASCCQLSAAVRSLMRMGKQQAPRRPARQRQELSSGRRTAMYMHVPACLLRPCSAVLRQLLCVFVPKNVRVLVGSGMPLKMAKI